MLPAFLVLISSMRFKQVLGGLSSYAVVASSILFTLLSIDFLAPMFLTLILNMNAEEMAKISLALVYVKTGLSYIALLLLGIGLWGQSRRLQKAHSNNA